MGSCACHQASPCARDDNASSSTSAYRDDNIGCGAGDIISERASTDNLFHASYDLRCAYCSGDLHFTSCAYHLNDVDASANIQGISSAHDIPCASCPHDFNDVGASDNLSSTCCSNDIRSSTNDLPRTRHGLRSAYAVWYSNV